MKRRLIVLGAGGFGAAVAEAVLLGGDWELVGFVDDRHPDAAPVLGRPVLGRLDALPSLCGMADAVVPAIGAAAARRVATRLAQGAGFELVSVVHPRAWVSPSARVGRGVTIMAGALIGTEVRIGDGVIVNAGVVLDHHVQVGEFAHLAVGACVGGGAVIDPDTLLGPGAALRAGGRLHLDC